MKLIFGLFFAGQTSILNQLGRFLPCLVEKNKLSVFARAVEFQTFNPKIKNQTKKDSLSLRERYIIFLGLGGG